MESSIESTLLLVRHGETESNRRRAYMGRSEEPLNERGRLQAQAIARRLSSFRFERIITSPIARAVQTAQAIGEASRIRIKKDDRFTEIEFGPWQGFTLQEVLEQYTHEAKLWRDAPHLMEFPGIETLAAVRERVGNGLQAILSESRGESVVIVTHDVIVRTCAAIVLGIDDSHYRSLSAANASLSIMRFKKERGYIDLLNDTSHLVS